MIKCEVVFDGEKMHIGRFVVVVDSLRVKHSLIKIKKGD